MRVYRWCCEMQWTLITLVVPECIDDLHEAASTAGYTHRIAISNHRLLALKLGRQSSDDARAPEIELLTGTIPCWNSWFCW